MKKTLTLLILLIFFIMKVYSLEKVTSIQGLLYLDHSPVSIEIRDGKIFQINRLKEVPENFPKYYIAPGFIDNQVNGYAGVSFAFGGGELTVDGVVRATRALWKEGVTTYLPTLTTNDRAVLTRNFSVLRKAIDDPRILGAIPGFHLEGPFISPEDGWRGAHPLQHVRKPDWEEFIEYYSASGENILQVTLAPETEGALNFISRCREKNIVVALGHHNASSEIITAAIDRGASIATHLGNGASNTINRHRNPFWPQLADDRLMISIIADGFHLLPEQIRVFTKVKGINNTIITSDVTSFAGLPPGEYTTSEGVTIELTPEGMLRYPEQNVLYGSASPINKGVAYVMKVTGCSLAEAVQMASANPARLYGLTDRGEILQGKRADFILFTIENFKIEIHKTIVAGQVVYSGDNK